MTCRPNTLNDQQLLEFACKHIRNDVHWFVRAMTNYENRFDNLAGLPRNTIVAYLDSALLHGRALLEFFSHKEGLSDDVRSCHYRSGRCPQTDRKGKKKLGADATNAYLMHLSSKRDQQVPKPVEPVGDRERWKLPELWELLECEFRLLANGVSAPGFENLFDNLITSEVPRWQAES